MKLSDPNLIANLIQEYPPPRKHMKRRGAPALMASAGPAKVRRCICGVCAKCVESAPWESIFAARFEDPTYYRPKPVRFGSSPGEMS